MLSKPRALLLQHAVVVAGFVLGVSPVLCAQPAKHPSHLALSALAAIKTTISQYHPTPFRYCPQGEWLAHYEGVRATLEQMDSLDMFQFVALASPLVTVLRDEHSSLLPSNAAWAEARGARRFFPFSVQLGQGGTLAITGSADPALAHWKGTTITAINGRPSEEILAILKVCGGSSASSGYQGTLYHALNHDNFARMYCLCVDQSDTFAVTTANGDTHSVAGLPDTFSGGKKGIYRFNEEAPPAFRLDQARGRAYLRISSFMPPAFKKSIRHTQRAVDGYFRQIKAAGVRHLTIDVRGNRGGTPFFSAYLAGYFFPQPYQPFARVTAAKAAATELPKIFRQRRKPGPSPHPRRVALPKMLPGFATRHPAGLMYTDSLAVLVDAGTGSAAAMFASLARAYGKTVFYGTETLGDAHITTGGQFHTVTLPPFGVELTIPLLAFHHGPEAPAHGTKPDHPLSEGIHLEIGPEGKHPAIPKSDH